MEDSPDKPPNSNPFDEMAERIRHNETDTFGGAFVIVPPEGGVTLQTLILDGSQEQAQFWLLLKSKCDVEIARLDSLTRQGHLRR